MKRKYVLKNRKRFFTFVMTLTVLFSLLVFAAAANGAGFEEYDTVVVERGDTLWDLAKRYCSDTDIRHYIEMIKTANDMTDSMIYEGDMLRMPV